MTAGSGPAWAFYPLGRRKPSRICCFLSKQAMTRKHPADHPAMSPPPPAAYEAELFISCPAPGDSTYPFYETQRCHQAQTTCSDSLRTSNKTSTRGPQSCKSKSTYLAVLEGGGGEGDARPRRQMPSELALILSSYEGHHQRVFFPPGWHGDHPAPYCRREQHHREFIGAKRANFPLRCPGNRDFDTASFHAQHRIIWCDFAVEKSLVGFDLVSDSIWCEVVGVGVGARAGSTRSGGDYLREALGWEKWANLRKTNKARSHKHTQAQATQPLHRGRRSPILTALQQEVVLGGIQNWAASWGNGSPKVCEASTTAKRIGWRRSGYGAPAKQEQSGQGGHGFSDA